MPAMRAITFTHKGWFGLCPVYLANIQSSGPDVHERHRAFAPLMWLSVHLFDLCFELQQMCDPAAEPAWPLKITGELRPPITLCIEGGA